VGAGGICLTNAPTLFPEPFSQSNVMHHAGVVHFSMPLALRDFFAQVRQPNISAVAPVRFANPKQFALPRKMLKHQREWQKISNKWLANTIGVLPTE
jgi:hypothetical protein